MGTKRRRGWSSKDDSPTCSKRRSFEKPGVPVDAQNHPTLRLYYRHVSTLRDFLLSQLPETSKKRHRRIAIVGKKSEHKSEAPSTEINGPTLCMEHDREKSLASLLDQTLICSADRDIVNGNTYFARDLEIFSQQTNLTAGSSIEIGAFKQSEIVDFAIWLLFHRVHRQAYKPPHLLCHGYQRAKGPDQADGAYCAVTGIPGIVSHYPNSNVSILKDAVWNDALNLLGKGGEEIMLKMIMHYGIFAAIENGRGNFYQLGGIPLTDLKSLVPAESLSVSVQASSKEHGRQHEITLGCLQRPRSPGDICFVRSRLFYARPILNSKGKVMFGLRHIHALNRFHNFKNENHTLHMLHYIFPRQLGLHNVFTSVINPKETAQPFKDYTMRDFDILRKARSREMPNQGEQGTVYPRIPKRLRGRTYKLVQMLQVLHSRCSYNELLRHYCPPKRSPILEVPLPSDKKSSNVNYDKSDHCSKAATFQSTTAKLKQPFTELATSYADVSAFCRAAISKVVPNEFWGVNDQGQVNKRIIMHNIDRFVKLGKFDPMSLHEVLQGLKIGAMLWLVPPKTNPCAKLSQTDVKRRQELLLEFLYYVFDSFVIPLIRSNFHVTESSVHQNHMFYFRHDVWRALTEPAMSRIKTDLFEEMRIPNAKRLLDARPLGYSQIRLLPKAAGMRPITNLRRRMTKLQNGKGILGRSINSVMTSVFDVLDFERRRRPFLTGCALFSVGDMYPKLKAFASSLGQRRNLLYFAKADAKSCFDTIPQDQLMRAIEKSISEDEYRIARHSEVKASKSFYRQGPDKADSKPARKFKSTAKAASDFDTFEENVESSLASGKLNTIFVDGIVQHPQKTAELLDLLEEHVRRNVVRIGKKFFRQTSGIPQGSIVSSLLCSYFYAGLEAEYLSFLTTDESVLLRLIDDFMLITTNKAHATQFLQIMHNGIEKYGVSINPAKTLANFDVVINGHHVPQSSVDGQFPYCGNMINTKTLEITKDRSGRKGTFLRNALTIDLSKVPGRIFYRKILSTFKIQTHRMFFDTNLNSPTTVLTTIYQHFVETAMKCYRYFKSMRATNQPSSDLLIGTIRDLIILAYVLVKGKHKRVIASNDEDDYDCVVSRRQIRWLAGRAFYHVLVQKQTKFQAVVVWLEATMASASVGSQQQLERLDRIAQRGDEVFRGYKY